ncbi:sugar ABC transporter permease [Kribbella sp. NPDC026611]|uniref:carbohydrate ABC transporter permease n=1 Tax=Kribbella sp. NPDC026611 TaxID=3154911 RepID=UPI0033D99336
MSSRTEPAAGVQLSRTAWHREAGRARRRENGRAYLLISVALLITGTLVLYPSAHSLVGSVFANQLGEADHPFVGLDNYRTVLTDRGFRTALINTFGYLVALSVLLFGIGLALATWLRALTGRVRTVAVAVIILPWAVPGTISGSLWALILNPTGSGLLNSALTQLGLIDTNVTWIHDPRIGTLMIGLMVAWSASPFAAIIFLAGLEGIPRELYESARVDRASQWQQFRSITLPLLRPAMALVALTGALSAIGLYDQVFVLVGNDPQRITLTGQVYLSAFQDFDFGFGYAASVLATGLSAFFAFVYLKFLYREVEY